MYFVLEFCFGPVFFRVARGGVFFMGISKSGFNCLRILKSWDAVSLARSEAGFVGPNEMEGPCCTIQVV